jgi:hypothetical protein
LISGIGWVSELVEIAGGIDIFADRRNQSAAKDRIVTVEEVVAREPDLIIGSWCGKKFRPERVVARPCFEQIPAVRHQDLYEIKSSLILQPGPAALTELEKIIRRWAGLLACKPLLSEKLAHQPQRRPAVPATLDQHVKDLALVIDGTPEVHPLAGDPNNHLVQVPSIARAGTAPL